MSPATRSSRSLTPRYSPYSRSTPPASTSSSSLPSSQVPASSRCRAVSDPSETHLSLSTANAFLHDSTDSVTWDSPGSPFCDSISSSNSMYQISDHEPWTDFARSPYSQSVDCPPDLANPHPGPAVPDAVHSLLNSRPLRAVQPSISLLDDSRTQSYRIQQPLLQLTRGHAPAQWRFSYYGEGMFSKSQNFSVKDSTFIDNSTTADNFMKEFLQHTIIGAEYDSSARYPPPRCHPGTRLAIVERCKVFITQCNGQNKMRWVFGPAGVGKSAIMQIVAEEIPADASVFFSVNGRRDGAKTIATIAYHLAAKYEPYRQFIRKEINRDPSLLRKSLPAQFQMFIVDPFIHRHLFDPLNRYLVIIDGLDECDNPLAQRELLELISDFCLSYRASPLVWLVASRPEPHITSFFDKVNVASVYTKEEIMIDSNEACEDVQRYLRDELNKIKGTSPVLKHKREWPSELEFTKIATAAGGLFAYASTVVRYIGDPHCGDPVSQLSDVLGAIDTGAEDDMLRSNHPLALLDALYRRILSNIPDGTLTNTKKLLLVHSNYESWSRDNFRLQCNRLGLTEAVAYGAVHHLHAVVRVPAPERADIECLTYFHKSFEDFLFDFRRSGFSRSPRGEACLLKARSTFRILEQIPDNFDGMACGEGIKCRDYGYLGGSPGLCEAVSLSWPGDDRFQVPDHELRLDLYRDSISNVCTEFSAQSEISWSISGFHALTTRFTALGPYFPAHSVRNSVFDKFSSELMDLGKLKQLPLRTLDYAAICGMVNFQFMGTVGMEVVDPWNPTCNHRKEDVDGLQLRRGWTTAFTRVLDCPADAVIHIDTPRFDVKGGKDPHWSWVSGRGDECLSCFQRLTRHFIEYPNQLATVFVDSTEMCYVELSFVDPDDGMSEWRYRFYHSGAPKCDN